MIQTPNRLWTVYGLWIDGKLVSRSRALRAYEEAARLFDRLKQPISATKARRQTLRLKA